METEPVVQLVDVVAVLDRFPALAGATLTVDRGEIVLLQGPNGAGKTTLLRLCAGLLPLARGTAIVLGLDLAEQRQAVRSRVGLLGHSNGLYSDLTVDENVAFWGATVGATGEEIAAARDRMGLGGRLGDVPVRKLSAGQRRRTALACLIARRAELWLLDEPHAGLDAAGRDELDILLRTATASGATMIVASHELDRAGALASRVVEVVGGQIRGQIGGSS
jgi:heme ABC exporter ATP-binding subunit CcmA